MKYLNHLTVKMINVKHILCHGRNPFPSQLHALCRRLFKNLGDRETHKSQHFYLRVSEHLSPAVSNTTLLAWTCWQIV